jgi:hypothetical protein
MEYESLIPRQSPDLCPASAPSSSAIRSMISLCAGVGKDQGSAGGLPDLIIMEVLMRNTAAQRVNEIADLAKELPEIAL